MVRVIQSYALISVGVKIIVTNVATASGSGGTACPGGKQTVFATQSGGKLVDNVSILFGAKFAASLAPIELTVNLSKRLSEDAVVSLKDVENGEGESPDSIAVVDFGGFAVDSVGDNAKPHSSAVEEENNDANSAHMVSIVSEGNPVHNTIDSAAECPAVDAASELSPAALPAECSVRGLVSKVGLGVGRSDNDRQFTFCNGRPVDLPRFAKVLNEVWRRYEMKQKPAFVLDIVVPAGYFDVNLTPDKREVLIVQEAVILDKLREVVDALYAPVRQTMPLNTGLSAAAAPNWATMFSVNDGADAADVPVTRKIQSALSDYLVPTQVSATTSSERSEEVGFSQAENSPFTLQDVNTCTPFNILSSGTPASQSTSIANDTPSSAQISGLHTYTASPAAPAPAPASASVLNKRDPTTWLSEMERERLVLGSPAGKKSRSEDAVAATSPASISAPALVPALAAATQSSTAATTPVATVAKVVPWSADPVVALEKYTRRRTLRQQQPAGPTADASGCTNLRAGSAVDEDAFDISANAALSATAQESAIAHHNDRSQARILSKKVSFLFCKISVKFCV